MGPYRNSPWHYVVLQSTKTTQGKLLAHATAEATSTEKLPQYFQAGTRQTWNTSWCWQCNSCNRLVTIGNPVCSISVFSVISPLAKTEQLSKPDFHSHLLPSQKSLPTQAIWWLHTPNVITEHSQRFSNNVIPWAFIIILRSRHRAAEH